MKKFIVRYRYRDDRNELFDVFETGSATSKKEAVIGAKAIANERAPAYGGKYWFMSVEPDNQS